MKSDHKRRILIVGLYPHTVIYQFKLIEKLKKEGYSISLSLRARRFAVGSEEFFIEDLIIYRAKSSSKKEVFLSLQNLVDSLLITQRHELGFLYFVKYLIRPLRNVVAKSYSNDDVFYRKQRKNLSLIHKLIIYLFFFSPKLLNNILASFEELLSPSRLALKSLIDQSPDIVFVSPANWENRNGYLSSEIEYVKAASKLVIPSVVYQLSFDNFYAREIIHVKPTLLISWVENSLSYIKKISLLDNEINSSVCGSLYLEMRFSDLNFSRVKEKTNQSKVLVYLGSASGIIDANLEYEYFLHLKNYLKIYSFELIYRSHPNNYPKKYLPVSSSFEAGDSLIALYKSLSDSRGVIGISTTLLFEAYSLGVPVFFNNMTDYDFESDLGMSSFASECNIISSEDDYPELIEIIENNQASFQEKTKPSDCIYNKLEELLIEFKK